MAATEIRELFPDDHILQQLFPNSANVSTIILSQTFETCTFIARVSDAAEIVVRLEVLQGNVFRLHAASALQKIASLAIPHLVPRVERTGMAQTGGGVAVEFMLTTFVPNSVTLESVWDDLADAEQSEIMKEVVGAMKAVYVMSRGDEQVQDILQGSQFILDDGYPSGASSVRPPLALGGPDIGYAKDVTDFLNRIVGAHNPAGKITSSTLHRNSDTNSVSIISAYDEFGKVDLSVEDLTEQCIVFCHGDLEPRNILVRPSSSHHHMCSYQVVAIIDWEMAGFFPLGYEYVAKDCFLGVSNQSFTWYSLFKQESSLRVDALHKCRRFMQAVDIIHSSNNKRLLDGRNVGALVREKWLAREQLERLPGIPLGWMRKADAIVPRYTKEDNEGLLLGVLKELGKI